MIIQVTFFCKVSTQESLPCQSKGKIALQNGIHNDFKFLDVSFWSESCSSLKKSHLYNINYTANIYSQITVGNVTLPKAVLITAISCTHDSH